MICRISEQDDPDRTLIRMWQLEEIVEKYLSAEIERRESGTLLSQYDCVYYSYDRAANTVTCYRCDSKRKKLCELELDKFREAVAAELPKSEYGVVEKFTDELKNGIRKFTGCFSNSAQSIIIFSGTAIYDDDAHIKTVGSFGNGSASPMRDLVRVDRLTGLALKEDISATRS